MMRGDWKSEADRFDATDRTQTAPPVTDADRCRRHGDLLRFTRFGWACDRCEEAWAECAAASRRSETKPDILTVCAEVGHPYPVSEQDLSAFIRLCTRHGVITNTSGEEWWLEISGYPKPQKRYARAQAEKAGKDGAK